MARIDARMKEEPIVPNPRPPIAFGFVRRSPIVAPNGRVRTNAIQNKSVLESAELLKYEGVMQKDFSTLFLVERAVAKPT